MEALKARDKEVRRLEAALDDLNAEASTKVQAMEREKADAAQAWDAALKQSQDECKLNEEEVARLNARVKEMEASIAKAESHMTDLKQESEKKVAKVQAILEGEREKLTSQVKDAEAEVARLQQALSETSDLASQKAAEAEASQASQASVAEREQRLGKGC